MEENMKLEAMKNTELFDLEQTIAARLFTMYTYPWEADRKSVV